MRIKAPPIEQDGHQRKPPKYAYISEDEGQSWRWILTLPTDNIDKLAATTFQILTH